MAQCATWFIILASIYGLVAILFVIVLGGIIILKALVRFGLMETAEVPTNSDYII